MDGTQTLKNYWEKMKPWNKRSVIEAALFNPAFCGELLTKTVTAYNTACTQGGFPYAMSYLVLPLLLNEDFFQALPKRSSTSFVSWVVTNEHLLIGLDGRVKSMKAYTDESLMICLLSGLLSLENNGCLTAGEANFNKLRNNKRDDVDALSKRSEVIGAWLGKAGDVTTVYSLLGITI